MTIDLLRFSEEHGTHREPASESLRSLETRRRKLAYHGKRPTRQTLRPHSLSTASLQRQTRSHKGSSIVHIQRMCWHSADPSKSRLQDEILQTRAVYSGLTRDTRGQSNRCFPTDHFPSNRRQGSIPTPFQATEVSLKAHIFVCFFAVPMWVLCTCRASAG